MSVKSDMNDLSPSCLFYKASEILTKQNGKDSIIAKTENSITEYIKFLEDTPENCFDLINIHKSEVILRTNKVKDVILSSIQHFLSGNIFDAVNIIDSLLCNVKVKSIEKGKCLYRGRSSNVNYLLSKKEMFHIPLNMRHIVKNQRYSLSGFPCLYLGENTYTCWEELERPDFGTTNFVALKEEEETYVYDLSFPSEFLKSSDFETVVIIIATSLSTTKSYDFKPEYIFPQILLHSFIKNRKLKNGDNDKKRGFLYHSTFMYQIDKHLFPLGPTISESDLDIYKSYVFPIINHTSPDFCSDLLKIFSMTNTISNNYVSYLRSNELLNVPKHIEGNYDSRYCFSNFSVMDKLLLNFDFTNVLIPSKRTYKTVMIAGEYYLSIVE